MLERCKLCLLFTAELCAHDPWWTLREALLGGVDLVQWREKRGTRAALERTLALCAEHAVPVIVNDDVGLACATGAAGAHVGQDDLPVAQARALLGAKWLGVSTHDQSQVLAAQAAGADYLGLGPCFATPTKGYADGLPRETLRAALAAATVPVYLIGGIRSGRLRELLALGGQRFAVSSAILGAASPREAARELCTNIASPNEKKR